MTQGKNRILVVALALAMMASSSSAQVPGEGWVELIDYNQITSGPDAGMYEYIYDVHNDVDSFARYFDMSFDATAVVNQFTYYDFDDDGTPDSNCLTQSWSSNAAGIPRIYYGGYIDQQRWPSYWQEDPNPALSSWVLPTTGANTAWAMDNVWHDGDDYDILNGYHTWEHGYADNLGVHWQNQQAIFGPGMMEPGLMFTFRLVHPMPKGTDNIPWQITYNGVTGLPYGGMIDGPVPEPATMSLLALGGIALLRKRR